MDRTQFSAFVGDIVRSQQRELMLKLKNLLGDADGALLLIPVSAEQWDQRVEVRQNAPGETHPSSIADREMPDGSLY